MPNISKIPRKNEVNLVQNNENYNQPEMTITTIIPQVISSAKIEFGAKHGVL